MFKNQKGFSALHILLLLIIAGIISSTGWYVWSSNKKTNDLLNSVDNTKIQNSKASNNNDTKNQANSTLKEYKNSEYGFSFQYPQSWTLAENLNDIGRGHKEGTITITSPNNTKVHFNPNQGGKGGDCFDEQANDQRTSRTCTTLSIYHTEKLSTSSDLAPIYYYHASATPPTREGGSTKYYIDISNYEGYAKTGTTIGPLLYPYDEISNNVGYITVYVEGKEDTKNNSKDFFDTQEVKEATPILKSFKFL